MLIVSCIDLESLECFLTTFRTTYLSRLAPHLLPVCFPRCLAYIIRWILKHLLPRVVCLRTWSLSPSCTMLGGPLKWSSSPIWWWNPASAVERDPLPDKETTTNQLVSCSWTMEPKQGQEGRCSLGLSWNTYSLQRTFWTTLCLPDFSAEVILALSRLQEVDMHMARHLVMQIAEIETFTQESISRAVDLQREKETVFNQL